jgi:hypothetical protein
VQQSERQPYQTDCERSVAAVAACKPVGSPNVMASARVASAEVKAAKVATMVRARQNIDSSVGQP